MNGMKPGDRVIWLHSPERSFLTGWRVRSVPGVIVRVNLGGRERIVNIDPENVMTSDEAG